MVVASVLTVDVVVVDSVAEDVVVSADEESVVEAVVVSTLEDSVVEDELISIDEEVAVSVVDDPVAVEDPAVEVVVSAVVDNVVERVG